MIDLRQKELAEWQEKNFGKVCSERLALGMAEEVGELCHYLLKRKQGIREATNSDVKAEIADAFADVVIFGINLMEVEEINAEHVLEKTIDSVLNRDWVKYPNNGKTA